MKKLLSIAVLVILCSLPMVLSSQNPPHPNGGGVGGAPTGSGNRVGDGPLGAPVGSGTLILLALGAAYAGRKMRNSWESEA